MMDLLDELAEMERAPYAGAAPLGFTLDYFTPDEFELAHLENVRRISASEWRGTRTWHEALTLGWCNTAPGHTLCILSVDVRCRCRFPYLAAEWEKIGPCECIGDLLYQANCPDCRWHHIGRESEVVAAWHDHAWPGWRDLPTVPLSISNRTGGMHPKHALDKKGAAKARAWIEGHYPSAWQVDGAPVVTERERFGRRAVPGYSPWGGFDVWEGDAREVPQ